MIDGSGKRNFFFAKAASDLKSSHVCEKRSKISLSEISVLQQYITAKLHVRTPNNVIFVVLFFFVLF